MNSTLAVRPRVSADMGWSHDRNMDWSDAIRDFVAHLRTRSYSRLTLRDYQVDLAQLATLIRVAPTDVRAGDFDAIAAELHDLGFGASVLRRKRAAHRAFVDFMATRNRAQPISLELWRAATTAPATERVLLGLLTAGGVRLGEIAALEGRDVRLRTETLVVRRGMRIVPLHPALADLFVNFENEVPLMPYRPLLAGLNGFAVNTRTMHARFRRMMVRLGHPSIRPDDLRRDVAAQLLQLGTAPGVVGAFLGRDRGRPVAPRRGKLVDLTSMSARLTAIPFPRIQAPAGEARPK